MNIVNNQYMALPLADYNHPLMVDVKTVHKHPAKTVESIAGLIDAASIYARKVLQDIIKSCEEYGLPTDEKLDLEAILSEERVDSLTGGNFVLFGKELTKEDMHGIIGYCGEELIGPDSVVSLEGVPEVVFSFHANNNAGGPTYIMSRLQFCQLFPTEDISLA